MKRSSSRIAFALLTLLAAACADHKAPQAPKAPAAAPPAAAPAPAAPPAAEAPRPPRPAGAGLGDGVKWLRTAAEYRAITISTYRAAADAVSAAAKGRARDSWAVVLDADETVLDNSVFQRDLAKGVAPFSEELWAAFVRQRSAIPVPGAKAFLDRVKELGGRIAIVTNRFEPLCEDTRENFRAHGLPFDVILCRATTGANTGDKNPRFEAAASGAAFGDNKAREVLAFVGDNILDFPALKQSLRDEPDSAYDAFGRRYFVLPNPMYGSWQQVPAR
ncbi:MAG: haloacid dehalogenase-like hydrolase [Vicinamibacteria bacterium]|nr:haloacid dehalogenase-like hydrolase [Vicinamibacteria bacterium]